MRIQLSSTMLWYSSCLPTTTLHIQYYKQNAQDGSLLFREVGEDPSGHPSGHPSNSLAVSNALEKTPHR